MAKVTYPYRWQDEVVISTLELIPGASVSSILGGVCERVDDGWSLQTELDLRSMIVRPGLRLENIDDKVIMAGEAYVARRTQSVLLSDILS